MFNENTAPEVAIIGSGFGFREVLPAILSVGDFKVHLMKPRDYSESKYRDLNHPNVTFDSLDEIANRPSIKIVFISAPPFLQYKYFEYLVQFGKSIYLEKPGGLNSSEALRIERLNSKYQSNLYLGFQFRFDPAIQMSAEFVNKFSKPDRKTAKIEWNIKKSLTQMGWKQDLEKGGGVYRDHLCHAVDLLRNSFGFSDDTFRSTHQSISWKNDLINHLSLKSSNVEIDINRDYDLESSLLIEIKSGEERVLIKTEFPFKLGNYSVKHNSKPIDLPNTIALDFDARRFALTSYIRQIMMEEYGEDTNGSKSKFPSIEDAIFTQQMADCINLI